MSATEPLLHVDPPFAVPQPNRSPPRLSSQQQPSQQPGRAAGPAASSPSRPAGAFPGGVRGVSSGPTPPRPTPPPPFLAPDFQEPTSAGEEESEDEGTSPPSSPPRFLEPSRRAPQDVAFARLYILCMLILVATSFTTLTRATHENDGSMAGKVFQAFRDAAPRMQIVWGTLIAIPVACLALFGYMMTDAVLGKAEGPGYLGIQYNIMIGLSLTFLLTSLLSVLTLLTRRRSIDQTIHLLSLSSQILWENPDIFTLAIALMVIYAGFAVAWLYVLAHAFIVHPDYPILIPTQVAVAFLVVMHFWTANVLQGVEKMTIAGVVGQWYFKRELDETHTINQMLRNLKSAVTSGFGTIALSSLLLAVLQSLHLLVQLLRRRGRIARAIDPTRRIRGRSSRSSDGGGVWLMLAEIITRWTSHAVDTVTSQTLL
ncbi:hypothetical protein HK101_005937, partial [Irineochytrium annulatum]